MIRYLVLAVTALLVFDVSGADAQMRRGGSGAWNIDHKVEITPFGGYSWTWSQEVFLPISQGGSGRVDLTSSGMWGVAIDITARPGFQFELLYNRQDTDATLEQGITKQKLDDVSVEYFHVGGVGGKTQGPLMGFGSFTLGMTRFNPKNSPVGDDWKFSVMMGLGAKYYASKRIGLRLQARLPLAFTSGGLGFGCGTGSGCGATFGGTGIAQTDVLAGLIIAL